MHCFFIIKLQSNPAKSDKEEAKNTRKCKLMKKIKEINLNLTLNINASTSMNIHVNFRNKLY